MSKLRASRAHNLEAAASEGCSCSRNPRSSVQAELLAPIMHLNLQYPGRFRGDAFLGVTLPVDGYPMEK